MDKLTIAEYEILDKAHKLRSVDEDYRIHQQAFLNIAAGAKKKNGKPVYSKFRNFYNYDAEQKKIINGNTRFDALKQYLKEQQKEDD